MDILRLKDILEEKKMQGKDLAEKVGVSATSISSIVKGKTFPKPETLLNIAKVLDIDIRELFIPTKENDTETIYVKRGENYLPLGEITKRK
jgi:transcriptional regulator with XRE-family HTH domain